MSHLTDEMVDHYYETLELKKKYYEILEKNVKEFLSTFDINDERRKTLFEEYIRNLEKGGARNPSFERIHKYIEENEEVQNAQSDYDKAIVSKKYKEILKLLGQNEVSEVVYKSLPKKLQAKFEPVKTKNTDRYDKNIVLDIVIYKRKPEHPEHKGGRRTRYKRRNKRRLTRR